MGSTENSPLERINRQINYKIKIIYFIRKLKQVVLLHNFAPCGKNDK